MTIDIHDLKNIPCGLIALVDSFKVVAGKTMYVVLIEDDIWHLEVADDSGDIYFWDDFDTLDALEEAVRCISVGARLVND